MPNLTHWLRAFGIDPRRFVEAVAGLAIYLKERGEFRARLSGDFEWGRELPILDERRAASGSVGAYMQQDLLVARWIFGANPSRHIDVGSRLDGFIGHLAVFREVEVLDIRPQPESIAGVKFHQLDLMSELPEHWVEAAPSLSCLHTLEHFGLGRYGDPIDADGHLKGLVQLKRLVAPGGRLYLSVPMGPQRVEFNAHRVFAASTLTGWFGEGWAIERFAVIDDQNRVRENVDWQGPDSADHFGCRLGVGIVVAKKL